MAGAVTGTTTVGNLDGSLRATVDPWGTLQPVGARWSLGWAVRAEDGWHIASDRTAASITRRRVDGTPVVESSLRVPGGQVVHRVWAARAVDGVEAVLVGIENRTGVPLGVALVVTSAARLTVDDRVVSVDRKVPMVLPRRPSRTAASLDELRADGGRRSGPRDIPVRHRGAPTAFVFPLAHTARLHVAIGARVEPASMPDADQVVSGWLAHLGAGLRAELPDAGAADAIRGDLADLLLASTVGVDEIVALDRFGHHGPARRALVELIDGQHLDRDHGRALLALAEHGRLAADRDLLVAAVGPVAAAAHRLRRHGGDAVQSAAAEILAAADQPEAAAVCRRRVTGVSGSPPVSDQDTPARRLLARRDDLVAETADGLVLVPRWPSEWLGCGLEVHAAPTRWGRLSFAVRWHGARPALLWERSTPEAVPLRVGLDPGWSTTEPRGEALLAPVEPAGGLPPVMAPLGDRATPVDDAAPEGSGFA